MHGDEVRYIRKQVIGLNQDDFARLIGVSRGTVWSWENGRTSVPELQAGIIKQLEQEAKRRDDTEEWARKLLALAVGGFFGIMLAKLFSNDES